jgi:hypothetical protein
MTTYYYCDFNDIDTSLSNEERNKMIKDRVKIHKLSVRAMKRIRGEMLSSESDDEIVKEIKINNNSTMEDDK